MLNCLTSLIENSLVFQTETATGESRFHLLEVVREYSLEVLGNSGESEMIKRNHAGYFLALAENIKPEFYDEQEVKQLDRLEDEHDNLRAVLSNSLAGDGETAINLAAALRRFWLLRNHLTEGHG